MQATCSASSLLLVLTANYRSTFLPGSIKQGSRLFSGVMAAESRPKVYVTRRVPQKGVELLAAECDVTQWDHDDPVPREELLHNVQGKDALFCLLTDKIDKAVLDAAGGA